MRHLGRVHRVSVQRFLERICRHPGNGPTFLFHEDTANMPADIYTKAFTTPDHWRRAMRLINAFSPDELDGNFLTARVDERHSLGRSDDVMKTRGFIGAQTPKSATVRESRVSIHMLRLKSSLRHWCGSSARLLFTPSLRKRVPLHLAPKGIISGSMMPPQRDAFHIILQIA